MVKELYDEFLESRILQAHQLLHTSYDDRSKTLPFLPSDMCGRRSS
ncbi:MAG: iron hydrogenase small subunit [Parasutterella sp.]